MSLLEKYNASAAGTNAGNARVTVGVSGVNFFDGAARATNNVAPDEYQEGFKPNSAGDYRYGGGGKTPGTYTASTWLNKALDKAKELYANAALKTILKGDTRNAPGTTVHKFTPDAKFQQAPGLSEFAKSKTL